MEFITVSLNVHIEHVDYLLALYYALVYKNGGDNAYDVSSVALKIPWALLYLRDCIEEGLNESAPEWSDDEWKFMREFLRSNKIKD